MENFPDVHHLKIWSQYFSDVKNGIKPFEVRKKDRDFKVGDTLILDEFDNEMQHYTGAWTPKLITYILDDPQFCKDGYVVLGLKAIEV